MCCHTTPLLRAINILPISLNIHLESLDLLRKCILSNSLTRYFYCEERHKIVKTFSGRVAKFCTKYDININKYVFNDNYMLKIKRVIKENYFIKNGTDGLIDSVRGILANDYDTNGNIILNMLLKSF